jgi:flagellar basal-body rod protein FlgB
MAFAHYRATNHEEVSGNMRFDLDSHFGVHAQAVKARGRRIEVLASNLANADTPGYKARDIDFKAAMEQVGSSDRTLRTTQPDHIRSAQGSASSAPLLYRVPMQPSQDGNTVDVQREQAAFAENAIRYQASLQFLSGRISGLINVLKGGSRQ